MLTAHDVMRPDVKTVSFDLPAWKAGQFLLQEEISGAVVLNAFEQPCGVITLADLLAHASGLERHHPPQHLADLSEKPAPRQRLRGKRDTTPVEKLMTGFLVRVDVGTPLADVVELINQTGIHRVFVTRDDRLVGVIAALDLVRVLGRMLQNQPFPRPMLEPREGLIS